MFNNSTFFIGVDLGDKHSYIAILDQDGELIEETRLPTTKTSFQQRFSTIPPYRVAMEVGSHISPLARFDQRAMQIRQLGYVAILFL